MFKFLTKGTVIGITLVVFLGCSSFSASKGWSQSFTPEIKKIEVEDTTRGNSGANSNAKMPAIPGSLPNAIQPPPPLKLRNIVELPKPEPSPVVAVVAGPAPIKLGKNYIRANLGLTLSMMLGNSPIANKSTYGSWSQDPSISPSILFGSTYGRIYNDFLAFEFDLRYRSSAKFKSLATHSPSTNKTVTTAFTLSSLNLMGLALISVPNWIDGDYYPYVSVGLGMGTTSPSIPTQVTQTASSSSATTLTLPDGSWSWIWAVGTGMDFRVTQVLSINVDYRFTNQRFQIIPVELGTPLDIYTHDISVGLKYRF